MKVDVERALEFVDLVPTQPSAELEGLERFRLFQSFDPRSECHVTMEVP